MILTAHLLAGAAIASKIQFAPLALILAFLSHYFLDAIPHQEYSIENIKAKRWKLSFLEFFRIFMDIVVGASIVFFLSEKNILFLAATSLSILPDGLTLLRILLPQNKLLSEHHYLHKKINDIWDNKKIPIFWKLLSQILICVLATVCLL